MAKTKALCIFTTVLGHKTVVSRLTEALDRISGLDATYLLVGVEDYARFRAPWWARVTDPWEAQFIARWKAQPLDGRKFDMLLVNAWELMVAFRGFARRMPAAAMVDATPATMDAQLRRQGKTGWKRRLVHQVHHRSFAGAVSSFDYFLPKGSETTGSLTQDYGVAPDRCFTTLASLHTELWKPGARNRRTPARLLFVGNDFRRKGGDFLLRLYSEHLQGSCTLTVASNDPALEGRRLPPGVEWLRGKGREELLAVYQDSDIFIFPTRQDFIPEALAEALAAGLPCFVTDIEGVRDLVQDGQTGFRLPVEAPAEVWADAIRRLLGNPSELSRLSANARRFAEDELGFERFAGVMAEVVERLRVHKKA